MNQNQPPLKLFFNQVDSASVICFIHGFQCYSALEERLPLILLTLLLVKGITYVMSKSNVTSRSAYVCWQETQRNHLRTFKRVDFQLLQNDHDIFNYQTGIWLVTRRGIVHRGEKQRWMTVIVLFIHDMFNHCQIVQIYCILFQMHIVSNWW